MPVFILWKDPITSVCVCVGGGGVGAGGEEDA
jgi:hypothetical protein